MSKQALGWNPNFDANDRGHVGFGSVSTATAREAIYDCTGIDVLSIQAVWTGTLAGTITVLGSNSFIPLSSDSLSTPVGAATAAGANARRQGTFTAITTRVTGIVNPAGSAGDCLINVASSGEPSVAHNFIKFRFVQSGGTGNLDLYVSGKSLTT